jgi:hypothetical protein
MISSHLSLHFSDSTIIYSLPFCLPIRLLLLLLYCFDFLNDLKTALVVPAHKTEQGAIYVVKDRLIHSFNVLAIQSSSSLYYNL